MKLCFSQQGYDGSSVFTVSAGNAQLSFLNSFARFICLGTVVGFSNPNHPFLAQLLNTKMLHAKSIQHMPSFLDFLTIFKLSATFSLQKNPFCSNLQAQCNQVIFHSPGSECIRSRAHTATYKVQVIDWKKLKGDEERIHRCDKKQN